MKKGLSTAYYIIFISILLTYSNGTAFAAKGEVVYKISGCSYFIVETNMGFAVLEWYGGNDPDKGDVLAGDFESYGMKDIYNLTADAELRVWVEDYWLSEEDALKKCVEHCE